MSEKLDLVARASQCLQSNPHAAQSGLDVIRKSIPSVLLELNKLQNDRERKRDELEREQTSLGRQINAKEDSKNKLKRDINAMEERKARNEALLNDARRELRNAESDKRDAEKKKSDAVAGTIGGSVGAVVLGILFPPSLAATIPAVVTAASVTITQADKAIDASKEKVSDAERSVNRENGQIRSANDKIADYERDISSLSRKQEGLYEERGVLRKTIVFLQQAVTYFGQLRVAVEGGQQRTDLLYKILDKANSRKILDSRGTTTVVNSFAEAWKQVEKSIMSGEQRGYLRIDFEGLEY